MIGIVIVTHGRLAAELLSATEHIVGPQTHVKTVCIGPNDDIEQRRNEITAAIAAVDLGRGVVLVTDMFGGTPCNLALTHLKKGKVEVLAGANLPSLIKLIGVRTTMPLDQAVKEAIASGKKYMRSGSAELAAAPARPLRLTDGTQVRVKAAIVNQRGLHARASAKFVETASKFRSEITVVKDDNSVSGRSIMGLMMLAAAKGTMVELIASGPDAREAIAALTSLIAARFHEDS